MYATPSSKNQKSHLHNKLGMGKNLTTPNHSSRLSTIRKTTTIATTTTTSSNHNTTLTRTPRSALSTGGRNLPLIQHTTNTRKVIVTSAPASKCKFTEKKPLAPKQTRSLALERSKSSATNGRIVVPRNLANLQERRRLASSASASNNNTQSPTGVSGTRTRIWNRPLISKDSAKKQSEPREKVCELSCKQEMGVQTNEMEILNSDLLIGDVKYMLPSQTLIFQIDQERNEARKRQLLKERRKFQEHDKQQEEHLNDLQEFLEKAAVTKRSRKQEQNPREALAMDRKLIKSMDELLSHGVPKSESITDIKSRIKKKEQELLTLFETIEKFKINNI